MVSTSPEPPRLNGAPLEEPQQSEIHTSSDSEDDEQTEVSHEGYELLPQQAEETEEPHPNGDTIEIENGFAESTNSGATQPEEDPMKAEREERRQLWAGQGGRDTVPMDASRTQQVLQAMAGFSLPISAVPSWASTVPEEEWRAKLEERLQAMNVSLDSPNDEPNT